MRDHVRQLLRLVYYHFFLFWYMCTAMGWSGARGLYVFARLDSLTQHHSLVGLVHLLLQCFELS